MQKPVPGQQRILGIVAFEVVHRVEEIWPAGLTLAPREGAKCVEPARDRRDEPAFAAAVSRDRTKDGRLRLVGPIGATEPLHGRSEEHTSELQLLMRISYAVFCL